MRLAASFAVRIGCTLHLHFCDEGIGPCLVYSGNAGAAIKDELTDSRGWRWRRVP